MKEKPGGGGVRLDRTGRHARVWFTGDGDSPPVISMEVMDRLLGIVEELSASDDLRSVTLRSEGEGVFLAGGDLEEFASLDTPDKGDRMARRMRKVLAALEALPIPVIAAIDGDVYGGGCETVLAADIRIASEDVRLAFSQGRFGLITGWGGATRLTRVVGPARAMFMLVTGRAVDANWARDVGLLDKVVPNTGFEDYLAELQANLEMISPEAVRAAKAAVLAARALPFDDALEHELDLFRNLWASPQHKEGLDAFFQHRAPVWASRNDKEETPLENGD